MISVVEYGIAGVHHRCIDNDPPASEKLQNEKERDREDEGGERGKEREGRRGGQGEGDGTERREGEGRRRRRAGDISILDFRGMAVQ